MSTQQLPQPVFPPTETSQRFGAGITGEAEGRTHRPPADGFLRQRFLPLCQPGGRNLPPQEQIEPGFMASYAKLCGLYTIEPLDSGRTYPANVLLCLWDAERQLNIKYPEIDLRVFDEVAAIAVKDTCSIGHILYYIPVLPLARLMKTNRRAGLLILSVFSYLYREVGVSYYRDEDAYLYSEYEAIGYWLEEETEDTEDRDEQLNELKQAECIGDRLFQTIRKQDNLRFFQQRVSAFRPADETDKNALQIAASFYELYRDHPEASIYSHIRLTNDEGDQYEDDDDYVMTPHHYLSFVADTKGWIWESVFSNVNNYLCEFTVCKEPECTTLIRPELEAVSDTLDFEHRLYRLISELTNFLEQIP